MKWVGLGSGKDGGKLKPVPKNQTLLNSSQLISHVNVSLEPPGLLIFQDPVKMDIFISNFLM